MSTSRTTTRSRAAQATSVAVKKGVSSASSTTTLTDATNTLGAKKSALGTHTRASSIAVSHTNGSTITSSSGSAHTRASIIGKQAEVPSRTTTTTTKSADSWIPLPAPVPMSSSRSFSELMKSEELLSTKVAQLQALVEKQQQEITKKDAEIRLLKSEVEETQEKVAKTHQSWEAKSEALLAQQHEKYQDLNDRYLVVLTRARSCESKLEEMFIDPLTLEPFAQRVAETEEASAATSRQRTILSLVEEHQNKENIDELQSKRDLESLLHSAVEKLKISSIDATVAAARVNASNLSESHLKAIELSIPSLLSLQNLGAKDAREEKDEDSNSDLDWSTASTVDDMDASIISRDSYSAIPIDLSFSLDHTESPEREKSAPSSWHIDPTLSDDPDDEFFNQSISE